MTRQVFEFTAPDRFVVGTVGMPGERTFFLQARQGNLIASVALEKAQVTALAERVDELLDEVRAPSMSRLPRSSGWGPWPWGGMTPRAGS
jgi:uncharacterized repeat protein (TIGR03847 family)